MHLSILPYRTKRFKLYDMVYVYDWNMYMNSHNKAWKELTNFTFDYIIIWTESSTEMC